MSWSLGDFSTAPPTVTTCAGSGWGAVTKGPEPPPPPAEVVASSPPEHARRDEAERIAAHARAVRETGMVGALLRGGDGPHAASMRPESARDGHARLLGLPLHLAVHLAQVLG